MMSSNDPRYVQQLVTDHQRRLLEEAANSRRPNPLRVAAGIALIRIGESLRGRGPASSQDLLPPVTGPSIRRLRAA